jgi:hypothetical protein
MWGKAEVLLGKLWPWALGVGELSVKETLIRNACEAGWDTHVVWRTAKLRLCRESNFCLPSGSQSPERFVQHRNNCQRNLHMDSLIAEQYLQCCNKYSFIRPACLYGHKHFIGLFSSHYCFWHVSLNLQSQYRLKRLWLAPLEKEKKKKKEFK